MTREHQHMTGISERLRNEVCLTSQLDWQAHVALARQAAHTIDELVRAGRELDPLLDSLVCYASTTTEYHPNRIIRDFRAALRRATGEE